jgi:hypothetical protein
MAEALGEQNLLGAVEFPLDSYALCWCGSSKKWKFCHKIRERQAQIPLGKQLAMAEMHLRSGRCQHPDASATNCSSADAIQSHTVQRRGGLGAIAEDGHVYSIKKGARGIEKNDGQVDMEKLGVGKASTFPGYCSQHDTALFKPVEMPGAVLDQMNGFLLSLRAVGYELSTKEGALNAHVASREFSDNGASFAQQVQIQNFIHVHEKGLRRGLLDVSNCKSVYDKALMSQDVSAFSLYGVTFDSKLPFAAAGAFMPEFDFEGAALQKLGTASPTSLLAFNLTQLNGKTSAVFGWFGGQSSPAARFVQSFRSVADEFKADALLLMSLEYLENVYFTPSWWDGLPEQLSHRLHQSIAGGLPSTGRARMALVDTRLCAFSSGISETFEKYSS